MSWRVSDAANGWFNRQSYPRGRRDNATNDGFGTPAGFVITATVNPVLQPLTNAQTPLDGWLASANTLASYSSTAGTISTAVREVRINGGAWTTTLSQNLLPGDLVEGRVIVTDSAANSRTFGAGARVVSAVPVTFSSAAAISGTPTVGQTLTAAATATGGVGSIALAYQWTRFGAPLAGQTATTYLTVVGDDLASIGCTVTATDSEGTSGVSVAPAVTVRRPAPAGSGTIGNVVYDQNSGDQTVDAAPAFTGAAGGSWSVSPIWATINTAGVVTLTTETLRAGETVTVTYTNSGGSATRTFTVTVNAVAPPPAFQLVFPADGTLEVDAENGTYSWFLTAPPHLAAYNAGAGPGVLTGALTTSGPTVFYPGAIQGTPTVGQTLSVLHEPFANYVGTLGVAYQWLRDGSPIAGATSDTWVISGSGVITLRFTLTDANGPVQVVSSNSILVGSTAAINSVSYDTAGILVDYTGTLTVSYDAAGFIVDVN